MPRFLIFTLLTSIWLIFSTTAGAAQEAVAEQAAEDILRSLAAGNINNVWDQKVSNFYKDHVPKDVFLAQISMAHTPLGEIKEVKLVSSQHHDRDPASGFRGDIYVVMFRATYTGAELFAQVVVVQDADGAYRLAGMNFAPVPKN